jgi:hypothetical protein
MQVACILHVKCFNQLENSYRWRGSNIMHTLCAHLNDLDRKVSFMYEYAGWYSVLEHLEAQAMDTYHVVEGGWMCGRCAACAGSLRLILVQQRTRKRPR